MHRAGFSLSSVKHTHTLQTASRIASLYSSKAIRLITASLTEASNQSLARRSPKAARRLQQATKEKTYQIRECGGSPADDARFGAGPIPALENEAAFHGA